jgi:hypothetical protein
MGEAGSFCNCWQIVCWHLAGLLQGPGAGEMGIRLAQAVASLPIAFCATDYIVSLLFFRPLSHFLLC